MKKSAAAALLPAFLGVLLAVLLSSCSALGLNREVLQPCTCGTPEADTFGCTAACALGEDTCDNPLCTCEHPDNSYGAPEPDAAATSQPTKN